MKLALAAYVAVGLAAATFVTRRTARKDRLYSFAFGLVAWPALLLFFLAEAVFGGAEEPKANFTPTLQDPTGHPD